MCFITRGILRWGLIATLGLGGLTLLIGPQRVAAGMAQVRHKLQGAVDKCVDDPIALRRQLQSLAEQYPDRIAEVRGELAAVDNQISQFNRDSEIAQRVVAMTTDDLSNLKTLVTRAEATAAASATPVNIRFENRRFDINQAYAEAGRINSVRVSYQDRLASNTQQLTILTEQKTRLSEILTKLDSEYQSFEAKLWQLDRQIDAIERNDRLIDMTKEMQATLESYSKFGKVGNLQQLESKLAELRTVQEAQLDALRHKTTNRDYESEAEHQLNTGDKTNPFSDVFDGVDDQGNSSDDDAKPKAKPSSNKDSVAFNSPIIIE
jgi:chromosome segregation ATPase